MTKEFVYLAVLVLLLFYVRRWYHGWLRRHRWWDWYNIYLHSWHWMVYRFFKILVYGRKCQRCGKANPKPLQVHHKHYKTLGHERIIGTDDTILVCLDCHRRLDKK